MTRSIRLSAKVTPAALIACRSQGARNWYRVPRAAKLAAMAAASVHSLSPCECPHPGCRLIEVEQVGHGRGEGGEIVDAVRTQRHDTRPGMRRINPQPADEAAGDTIRGQYAGRIRLQDAPQAW